MLTLFVNSVTEAYEQKQREKRIRILKIKQTLDEISYLLEELKGFDVANEIRDFLLNEIMARLQFIQRIDRNFTGIQELIDEASEESSQEAPPPRNLNQRIKNESEFNKQMAVLRRLITVLNSKQWYSKVRKQQIEQFSDEIKVLRCEKIAQFYTDLASKDTDLEKTFRAKEHYNYIIHGMKTSGVSDNPRVIELKEQAEFMLAQVNIQMSHHMEKLSEKSDSEEVAEQQENLNQEKQTDETKNEETAERSQ